MSETKVEKKEEVPVERTLDNLKPSLADAIKVLKPFCDRIEVKAIVEQFKALKNNGNELSKQVETKASEPKAIPVQLRIDLRKLSNPTASDDFDKAIHKALLALAYYQPINSENLSMEPFNPFNTVAASTGQQFDLIELRNLHVKRPLKADEKADNKKLINPLNGHSFSGRDSMSIQNIGYTRGVFFRGLITINLTDKYFKRIESELQKTKLNIGLTIENIKKQIATHTISLDPQEKQVFEIQYSKGLWIVLYNLNRKNQLNQKNLDTLLTKFCYARVGLAEAAFYLGASPDTSLQFEKLFDLVQTEFSSNQADYFNVLNDMLFFLVQRGILNYTYFNYLLQLQPNYLSLLSKFLDKLTQFSIKVTPKNFLALVVQANNLPFLQTFCDSVLPGGTFTTEEYEALLTISKCNVNPKVNSPVLAFRIPILGGIIHIDHEQIVSSMKALVSILSNMKTMNLELSELDFQSFIATPTFMHTMDNFERIFNEMRKASVAITVSQLKVLLTIGLKIVTVSNVISRIQNAGVLLNEKDFDILVDYSHFTLTVLNTRNLAYLKYVLGILAIRKTISLEPSAEIINTLGEQLLWTPKILLILNFMQQRNITITKEFFEKDIGSSELAVNWKELEKLIKFFETFSIQISTAEFYAIIKSAQFLENFLELLKFFPTLQIQSTTELVSMLIAKSSRWNEVPTCQLLQDLIEFKPAVISSSSSTSSLKEEQKAVLEYSGRLHSPTPKRKAEQEHEMDPRKEGSIIKEPKTAFEFYGI